MKKKTTTILVHFVNGLSLEEVYKLIEDHFMSLTVHCIDTLRVIQCFREAYRGYLIAQGGFRYEGKICGRAPITTIDSIIEKTGRQDEISFVFEGKKFITLISKFHLRISQVDDEEVNKLLEYIKSLPLIKNVEVSTYESIYKPNLFYTDIAHRLETGDFEDGGELKSREKWSE